ncbi:glycosyltransferase family 2 protein [Azospirillum brasilense]|uniref:glycosyltransferase family 2 protein n=1 Tax=Azospirillum brasilense TaxID=192 RepID=UPI003AF43EDA
MTVSTIDRPADHQSDRAVASVAPAMDPDTAPAMTPVVAVLIPCYNEETAIAAVVQDFRKALPDATVYVYDNNSSDRTVEVAKAAGAVVRHEPLQGKGNVMRRMFSDIEADVYVLVDGDDTYHAPSAPLMVKRLWDDQLDMVNGARVTEIVKAYRPGHRFGNKLLTGMVALIFGNRIQDMLSGYRVFSRRFIKSFPALASGFETETELTVHALELNMPIAEIKAPYKDRPPGSHSKLNTIRDGVRILRTIVNLVKEERPLPFFFAIFAALAAASVILAWPVVATYLQTGLVPRLPTAVLSTGLMLLGFLSLTCGLILDTVTLGRREAKRMRYLSIPAPGVHPVRKAAGS